MQKALKQCRFIGCTELSRDAYCPSHKNSNDKEYRKYRTDKREQSFYSSSAWLKVRAMALSRDHGLCQHCLREGKVILADVVHHIIEIKVDWEKRLVLSNLICLCDRCHNIVHKSNNYHKKGTRSIPPPLNL